MLSNKPNQGRKPPRCRKCGELMSGHKRPNGGSPLCPLLRRSTTPTPEDPQTDEGDEERQLNASTFEGPASGQWHWINPNWTDPAPPSPTASEHGSDWVSTEMVDEYGDLQKNNPYQHGNGLYKDHVRPKNNCDDMLNLMPRTGPASEIKIFQSVLHDDEVYRVGIDALRKGLHMRTVVNTDYKAPTNPDKQIPLNFGDDEDVYWVILGRNRAVVDAFVNEYRDSTDVKKYLKKCKDLTNVGHKPVSPIESDADPNAPLLTFAQTFLITAIGCVVIIGGLPFLK